MLSEIFPADFFPPKLEIVVRNFFRRIFSNETLVYNVPCNYPTSVHTPTQCYNFTLVISHT
jgi:hypothetical protein